MKDTAKKAAVLAILNMGVVHLIEGPDIDRPRNAITSAQSLHGLFDNFEIFLGAISGEPHLPHRHVYTPWQLSPDPNLPLVRTPYLTRNRDNDPPSPRLLAIHSAIAHILHLSGAGEYIDRLLDDAEDHGVRADGSTELGRLVNLGSRRWAGGILGS